MNIIESFYVLFKGDATDLKKTSQEAKRSVQSVHDALTGVFPKQQEERIGRSFSSVFKSAISLLGATTAAYKVFNGVTQANSYALQLGDTSRALGVNATELDAWGNAVKNTGGTSEGFQASLKALSAHFGSSAKVALDVLPKLADTFQRLGNFRSLQYGKMLGLDEATIMLLQQGRREVEGVIRRQRELSGITENSIEDARQYRNAQTELDSAFRGLYLTLAHDIIPIFTKAYKKITPVFEYLTRHKDLVIGALIGIGVAAGVMAIPFVIANGAVIGLTLSIAALIGAFALLFEDFKYFDENKPSLLGLASANHETLGKSLFRGGNAFGFLRPHETNALDNLMQTGRNLMLNAESSPINSQTSNSTFTASSFARNSSINTGPINIHTQATDAVGISKAIGKTFKQQMIEAANGFADGVAK